MRALLGKILSGKPFSGKAAIGRLPRLVGALVVAATLAGCQADELGYGPKASRPLGPKMNEAMSRLGIASDAPVLMRIFKEESKFEVWRKDRTGRYALLATYDICKWSGRLGPKIKEGDRQAPEGYYTITPGLMNPNSAYHLSFNTGFPNAYDRANGRTGSALMVHGACSSRGCYAMTDAQIQEIYTLARDAFRGGQKAFQLQAYPFRMTAENMARHWDDPNMPFWRMLKEGYDTFELTRQEPRVDVCGRKYVFNATAKAALNPAAACPELVKPPELVAALTAKAKADDDKAVVMAARFRTEREAEERRQILIAQNVEAERRRAEEARIAALQPRGDGGKLITALVDTVRSAATSVGNVAGVGGEPTATGTLVATAPAPTDAGDPVTTAAVDAAPLPRRDPRLPEPEPALALVAAPQPPSSGVGAMFGRLFSFGSDEAPPAEAAPEPVVAAVAPAATAPVATAPVAAAATVATARPSAARPAAARPNPTVATAPVAAAPPAVTPAAAIPPLAAPAPSGPALAASAPAVGEPACTAAAPCQAPVTAAAAEPTPSDKSLMDRIGNWF
ncbi:L,D-transpeptidase family protein [Oharaeibacter diazotrophicus]|uniref:Murein L,D-transpeptidase YafK n=2 Tax=Oharaeibacter diazotrophicus TaxID=1920512 RepID=A0A4R6RD63_9HYPH|nr:murein L,D-transpeptidase family protein [Oharaeibacter diazotrophicus]TDP84024.1 murein L,D-transpeptidase YafK [Oharaeibacter diazotrophicus]BBE73063.1 hypothetical protein OHA_1_02669 [Pleomorphomonas sp. SM30]GLS74851.1 hypothetical protein GCM10007904_01860 [Oharaeibacter diazotrophicus]